MQLVQAVVLGLLQGLTEFIPVSSSGHLVLVEHWLGFSQAGLTFDIALHLGTLGALLAVFWTDLKQIILKWRQPEQGRLLRYLVIGTVPAIIFGLIIQGQAETAFRSVRLVAFNLVFVALIMLLVDRPRRRTQHRVNDGRALVIGLGQAAALVPGVSRSGATITAGLLTGLDRVSATRFSFLLAVPATAGAALKVLLSDGSLSQVTSQPLVFAAGALAAAASGYWAIRWLLRFLAGHSLAVFAYYRIGLGVLVLMLGSN